MGRARWWLSAKRQLVNFLLCENLVLSSTLANCDPLLAHSFGGRRGRGSQLGKTLESHHLLHYRKKLTDASHLAHVWIEQKSSNAKVLEQTIRLNGARPDAGGHLIRWIQVRNTRLSNLSNFMYFFLVEIRIYCSGKWLLDWRFILKLKVWFKWNVKWNRWKQWSDMKTKPWRDWRRNFDFNGSSKLASSSNPSTSSIVKLRRFTVRFLQRKEMEK